MGGTGGEGPQEVRGGGGGWQGSQCPRLSAAQPTQATPPCCLGLTLWDQYVGQDGEASHGLEAGQGHAVAQEAEQESGGGPAQ